VPCKVFIAVHINWTTMEATQLIHSNHRWLIYPLPFLYVLFFPYPCHIECRLQILPSAFPHLNRRGGDLVAVPCRYCLYADMPICNYFLYSFCFRKLFQVLRCQLYLLTLVLSESRRVRVKTLIFYSVSNDAISICCKSQQLC